MTAFADMPDDFRLTMRCMVDRHKGAIMGYEGDGVTIALPNTVADWNAIDGILAVNGFKSDGTVTYFPLGTDNPPANLRHRNRRYQSPDDAPGYWLYAHYRPVA